MAAYASFKRVGLCKDLNSFHNIFPVLFLTFQDVCISANVHKTANRLKIPPKSQRSVIIIYLESWHASTGNDWLLRWKLSKSGIHLQLATNASTQYSLHLRGLKLNLSKDFPAKYTHLLIRLFTWFPYSFLAPTNTSFFTTKIRKSILFGCIYKKKNNIKAGVNLYWLLVFFPRFLVASFWAIYSVIYSQHRITMSKSWFVIKIHF